MYARGVPDGIHRHGQCGPRLERGAHGNRLLALREKTRLRMRQLLDLLRRLFGGGNVFPDAGKRHLTLLRAQKARFLRVWLDGADGFGKSLDARVDRVRFPVLRVAVGKADDLHRTGFLQRVEDGVLIRFQSDQREALHRYDHTVASILSIKYAIASGTCRSAMPISFCVSALALSVTSVAIASPSSCA